MGARFLVHSAQPATLKILHKRNTFWNPRFCARFTNANREKLLFSLFAFHTQRRAFPGKEITMQQLYTVKITRVIMSQNLQEARRLALSIENVNDVELVEPIQNLFDIPTGWEDAIPYGAETQTTRQCLVAQLAADTRFNGFEVHPSLEVSKDKHGQVNLEQCDENDPAITVWSVYGHLIEGGLECLADFDIKSRAEEFFGQIIKVQSMWAEADEYFSASGTRPVFAEDEHLESYFEDRISDGDIYGGQPLAEDW
jgi:hypothetical protein